MLYVFISVRLRADWGDHAAIDETGGTIRHLGGAEVRARVIRSKSGSADAGVQPLSTAGQGMTPFADAVLALGKDERHGEQIVSFHALPWSQGRSFADSGLLGEKYRLLFGPEFLASEVSYSSGALDSYVRPTASLDLAQQLAADAFGANYTFFVTCGTTIANQVAFEALAGTQRRVLVDRTAHQSLHVAVGHSRAAVEYAPSTETLHEAGELLLDVPQMLKMVETAARSGRPYETVILAASSYDGLLYDMDQILPACLKVSPTTAFLVDEAWAAINTFHPRLRPFTAMYAAERLAAAGTPITLLVTQSAHKSMSAARQGSYLHVVSDATMVARVASILYGRHTTSPSIPILASLDLARAHAQSDGARLLQYELDLAEKIRATIADDARLAQYRTASFPVTDSAHGRYFVPDPTKVLIDVTGLGIEGDEARLRLFHDYGIYVSRTVPRGFLANLHIGISDADVNRLLGALRSIARREYGRMSRRAALPVDPGAIVDGLVIAYPPGVPIAVPGELWTDQLRERVKAGRHGGAEIYILPVDQTNNFSTIDTDVS